MRPSALRLDGRYGVWPRAMADPQRYPAAASDASPTNARPTRLSRAAGPPCVRETVDRFERSHPQRASALTIRRPRARDPGPRAGNAAPALPLAT